MNARAVAGMIWVRLRLSFCRTRPLIDVQDMSEGLFQQLGDLNTGVLSISWDFT